MNSTYLEILKKYWGYEEFQGIQADIIQSISEGYDTLGLMPTGGGKSITFQVPTMAQEGICIVVTPLIALMKDQVANLKERGIKAAAIYSGMSLSEITVTLDNCIFGGYKFLYVSPERLATDLFKTKMEKMPVCLFAIDESHCISQWGYDFRPAYTQIASIRELKPQIPILALTATATPDVVVDIQDKLHFKEPRVYKMSFERTNLAYIVHHTDDKYGVILKLLQKLSGSTIIYARSRKRTKDMTDFLVQNGISATFYHAGLNNDTKDKRQKIWQSGECRVMVATNAFGMGIDKPDVRLVLHIDLPDSIEAYFQEAGRAGRDGKNSRSIILYSNSDKTKLEKRIKDSYPEKNYILDIYEHLQYYFQMAMGDGLGCVYDFNLEEFCLRFKHFPIQAHNALSLLTQAGYIEYTEEQDNPSKLIFTVRRDELYKLKELPKESEAVLNALLRTYTGVFTDYIHINESILATRTGLTKQQVYNELVFFSRKRIINYIPRKKTPFLIYTRERIDRNRVIIPKSVYEDRKKSYTKRINAMLDFVQDAEHCRSRQLLQYFGEHNETNCMQCDVCIKKNKQKTINKDALTTEIISLVKDKSLSIANLCRILEQKHDEKELIQHFRFLIDEGIIKEINGIVHSV